MVKYKNMSQAKKRIRSIINNVEKDTKFLNNEIISLLLHHPDKRVQKKEDIEYLMVKYHPLWVSTLALFIKTKGNEEDNVSWMKCIKNLFNKFDKEKNSLQHIKSAFREEIAGTSRRDFFYTKLNEVEKIGKSWRGICTQCKERKIISSDHKPPFVFKIILRDFLKEEHIKLKNVKFHRENGLYKLTDTVFKNKWISFHDDKVEWQLLCRSCNSKNGTYGF